MYSTYDTPHKLRNTSGNYTIRQPRLTPNNAGRPIHIFLYDDLSPAMYQTITWTNVELWLLEKVKFYLNEWYTHLYYEQSFEYVMCQISIIFPRPRYVDLHVVIWWEASESHATPTLSHLLSYSMQRKLITLSYSRVTVMPHLAWSKHMCRGYLII